MKGRKRAAILISGRGSNMAALIEAAKDPAYPVEIAAVISNRPAAPGLALARDIGASRQNANFRRRQGRFLVHVPWPISSRSCH